MSRPIRPSRRRSAPLSVSASPGIRHRARSCLSTSCRSPRPARSSAASYGVADVDIREKAEGIAALFRDRQQIDMLPPELMPADLDEAYLVRAALEELEQARGRREVVGYERGLTPPIMEK